MVQSGPRGPQKQRPKQPPRKRDQNEIQFCKCSGQGLGRVDLLSKYSIAFAWSYTPHVISSVTLTFSAGSYRVHAVGLTATLSIL